MILKRKLPVNFKEEDLHLFQHELSVEANEPAIHELNWLLLDAYWSVSYNQLNEIKKHGLLYSPMPLQKLLSPRVKYIHLLPLFFDEWSINYFHWFTEVIPKLIYLLEYRQDLRFLIPDFLYDLSFVRESLPFLPELQTAVVTLKQPTKWLVKKTVICDLNMAAGNYHPALVQKVRDRFVQQKTANVKTNTAGIFIYRSLALGRSILNFKEVEEILKKYKIETVDFGLLSVEEQIKKVQSSKVLIGVHGAGLTNMLFMQEASTVFELRKKGDSHNNCYFTLASALNHCYYYQQCAVDDEQLVTQRNNFMVDIPVFENNLKQLLHA